MVNSHLEALKEKCGSYSFLVCTVCMTMLVILLDDSLELYKFQHRYMQTQTNRPWTQV